MPDALAIEMRSAISLAVRLPKQWECHDNPNTIPVTAMLKLTTSSIFEIQSRFFI
jgi:hypothetical protein